MSTIDIKAERLKRQQCPTCGTDLEVGYGLAGGGMGPYLYCGNDTCKEPYFEKFQENDDAQSR